VRASSSLSSTSTGQLSWRQILEVEARRQGFQDLGVTDLSPFRVAGDRARRALEQGRLAGMPWYHPERVRQATDLSRRFPWGRSLVALAYPYAPASRPLGPGPRPVAEARRPRGRVAAYALGDDYHLRLDRALHGMIEALSGRSAGLRWHRFVDHGWAFDRAIAERAGIGFCGKHTQLISRSSGSYVLLASLVLSLELPADRPSKRGCGTCVACLSSCPTAALAAPGVLTAPLCISYLTIEHEGPIPAPLRSQMGSWVFGCDLCQEACPINARLSPPPVPTGLASSGLGPVPFPDLLELLLLTEPAFEERFRGTTVRRSGRARLARNAAVALGNQGNRAAVPGLTRALQDDPSPWVRGASAWALARLGGRMARLAVGRALARERDPAVLEELQTALAAMPAPVGAV